MCTVTSNLSSSTYQDSVPWQYPYPAPWDPGTPSSMQVLPPRIRLPTPCIPLVAWSRPATRVAHMRHHYRPQGHCKTAIISFALLKRKACSPSSLSLLPDFVHLAPCLRRLCPNSCPFPTSPTSGSSNNPREGSLSFGAPVTTSNLSQSGTPLQPFTSSSDIWPSHNAGAGASVSPVTSTIGVTTSLGDNPKVKGVQRRSPHRVDA